MFIQNGTIIDGTKRKQYKGNIRIRDGIIQEMGDIQPSSGEEVIDAGGKYVVPGFVDLVSYSDIYLTLFSRPNQESLTRQGVTTILVGNEEASLAPLTSAENIESIQKWADPSLININWLSVKEYIEELKLHTRPINVATLIGHSTVRRGIVQDDFRELSGTELKEMLYLIEQGLIEGAFGVSFGLGYSHAKVAPLSELIEIARLVKKYDGLYSVHLRNEEENILDSVREVLKIVRDTGVRTEIVHLKAIGKDAWPLFPEVLTLIQEARKEKLPITFDVYPYTKTSSILYTFLPDWAVEGGKKKLLLRIKDSEVRSKIVEEMRADSRFYDNLIIVSGKIPSVFIGKSIKQIAENQEVSTEEAILNLIIASEDRITVFSDTISDENVQRAIRHEGSFIASSSAGYAEEDKKSGLLVHPRSFATFTRFLAHYVRVKKLLSWEDAIYKITWGPAQKIGLPRRGKLAEGFHADIVIFDPEHIEDRATFDNPYRYSDGIYRVLINGNKEGSVLVRTK